MAREMRLIDATAFSEEIAPQKSIAERVGDKRAAETLAWVLERLESAPTLFLRSDEERNKKHKYGEYKNVLLSDDEYEKVQEEFPEDFRDRIEAVSAYVAVSGKTYKNYLAVIRNWARRDGNRKMMVEKTAGSFETDDFFEAALVASYGGNL